MRALDMVCDQMGCDQANLHRPKLSIITCVIPLMPVIIGFLRGGDNSALIFQSEKSIIIVVRYLMTMIVGILVTIMTEESTRPRTMTEERAFSRNTTLIARLLGEQVRLARRQKRWSEAEAAERARISRATLQKIERGGLGVALGLVLEVCTIVGVSLFGAGDTDSTKSHLDRTRLQLAALPRRIRSRKKVEFNDDF